MKHLELRICRWICTPQTSKHQGPQKSKNIESAFPIVCKPDHDAWNDRQSVAELYCFTHMRCKRLRDFWFATASSTFYGFSTKVWPCIPCITMKIVGCWPGVMTLPLSQALLNSIPLHKISLPIDTLYDRLITQVVCMHPYFLAQVRITLSCPRACAAPDLFKCVQKSECL